MTETNKSLGLLYNKVVNQLHIACIYILVIVILEYLEHTLYSLLLEGLCPCFSKLRGSSNLFSPIPLAITKVVMYLRRPCFIHGQLYDILNIAS